MQIVILACLAAMAAAAPQPQDSPPVAILRDDRQDSGEGNFNYAFEAENGISVEASGSPGSEGQSNIQGVYRFPLDDGTVAEVRYVADDNGFRPESPLLPTPHPLPAHVHELLRIAEDQRARGITFK
ncbi:cuticle protein AM1159-like [Procambarus clarkii]|uniref:cuticle protein AM1159-like n=1 Tax=Procambarus clarkii TaxID=6728 RepID=UPI00374367DB